MGLADEIAAGTPVDALLVLVAAHPDDETVGLGSRLGRLQGLKLIHLTDGAPRSLGDARRAGFADWQGYAAARERELERALECLGAGGAERVGYGLADQEGVFHLAALVDRLAVDMAGAAAVLTHPYEHGHPDHDTAALAVALAGARLRRRGEPAPARLEFSSYHLAGGKEVFGRFWSDPARPERTIELDDDEAARKAAAIACHATQQAILARFPPRSERLREAPDYDFHAPAPPGEAFYDRFGWGITAARWREEARRILELEG